MKGRKRLRYRLAVSAMAAFLGCGMLSWNDQAFVSAGFPVKQELTTTAEAPVETEVPASPDSIQETDLLLPLDRQENLRDHEVVLTAAPCIVVEDNTVKREASVPETSTVNVLPAEQQSAIGQSPASQSIVQSLERKGTPKENYKIAETDPDVVLDAAAFTSGPPDQKTADQTADSAGESKEVKAAKDGQAQETRPNASKAAQKTDSMVKTEKHENRE